MPKIRQDTRIKKEIERLSTLFAELSLPERELVDGLINRAAFIKIQMEDIEKDILINGTVEDFCQSVNMKPYKRLRPIATQYNSFISAYKSVVKQLFGMMPKERTKKDDGFGEF